MVFSYLSEKFSQLTLHSGNENSRKIPILNLSLQNQENFCTLVDQMLDAQKLFHNAKSDNDKKMFKQKIEIIDKQIDELVYKLYELTDEEIKIVEGK